MPDHPSVPEAVTLNICPECGELANAAMWGPECNRHRNAEGVPTNIKCPSVEYVPASGSDGLMLEPSEEAKVRAAQAIEGEFEEAWCRLVPDPSTPGRFESLRAIAEVAAEEALGGAYAIDSRPGLVLSREDVGVLTRHLNEQSGAPDYGSPVAALDDRFRRFLADTEEEGR